MYYVSLFCCNVCFLQMYCVIIDIIQIYSIIRSNFTTLKILCHSLIHPSSHTVIHHTYTEQDPVGIWWVRIPCHTWCFLHTSHLVPWQDPLSGISAPSVHVSDLCQYHTVLITVALWYGLKSKNMMLQLHSYFSKLLWLFEVFSGSIWILGLPFLFQWRTSL